jgi:DNA repair protein RadC
LEPPLDATAGQALESDAPRPESDECLLMPIASLIGAGRTTTASVAAAGRLLRSLPTVRELALASNEELRRLGRLSDRQASLLRAAIQAGRRLASSPLSPGQQFANSRDLFERYRARFYCAQKEHFYSLHLNSKNRLIREVLVSVGSLTCSVVHPREVFSQAVRDSTAALIFLHNHPSGDPQPSREDRECTTRLLQAGRIIGIRVLDHVILGHAEYFSFADAGLLHTVE